VNDRKRDQTYAQQAHLSRDDAPTLSSSCLWPSDAQVRVLSLEVLCLPTTSASFASSIQVHICLDLETYGAALVSSKMFRFLRSCTSGLCVRCFSSELRRSIGPRVGEMGVVSTSCGVSVDMLLWVSVISRA